MGPPHPFAATPLITIFAASATTAVAPDRKQEVMNEHYSAGSLTVAGRLRELAVVLRIFHSLAAVLITDAAHRDVRQVVGKNVLLHDTGEFVLGL